MIRRRGRRERAPDSGKQAVSGERTRVMTWAKTLGLQCAKT